MLLIYLFAAINFMMLAPASIYVYRRSRYGLVSPFFMLLAGCIIMYVMRPVYIAMNGEWGVYPGARQYIYSYEIFFAPYFYITVWMFAISSASMFLFSKAGVLNFAATVTNVAYARGKFSKDFYAFLSFWLIVIFVWLGSVLSMYGLSDYLLLLGQRAKLIKDVFGDYGFYMESIFFVMAGWGLMIYAKNINNIDLKRRIFLALIIAIPFLMLGGRSNFLLCLISVAFLEAALAGRKLRILSLAAFFFAFAIILVGVAYRVWLRDSQFSDNQGMDLGELIYSNVFNIFDFFVGGYDFVQFDALVNFFINDFRLFFGATFAACLVSFIPRAIWLDKPMGGMGEFTKMFFPEHFNATGGEFVVSWIGEWYMNFGVFSLVGGIISILLLCYFVEFGARDKVRGYAVIVIMAILAPRAFNLMKADLLNNFMAIIKFSFVPLLYVAYGYFGRTLRAR